MILNKSKKEFNFLLTTLAKQYYFDVAVVNPGASFNIEKQLSIKTIAPAVALKKKIQMQRLYDKLIRNYNGFRLVTFVVHSTR